MGFIQSQFLVLIKAKNSKDNACNIIDYFSATAGIHPDCVHETTDFNIAISYSQGASIEYDKASRIALLLHGEIYSENGIVEKTPAKNLLYKYQRDGLVSLAKSLNGSCAVLVIDERTNVVALITDRVCSRKVFYSRFVKCHWMSTSLTQHPVERIDPAGVASYLMNRFIYAGRTVFDGVTSLERASIHIIKSNGVESKQYWTYDLSPDRGDGISDRELKAQFADLLSQSVKSRCPEQGYIGCSLSGGYDSRAVFGLISSLWDKQRIKCFSFGAAHDDDVVVAKMVANSAGVVHQTLSFKGDLVGTIKANANLCEGLAYFYSQGVDGFDVFAGQFGDGGVLFVGDQYIDGENLPLSSFDDVLEKAIGIKSNPKVPDYYSYGKFRSSDIGDVLCEDNRSLRQRCAGLSDWNEMKSFLYVDQRLSHMILPWREFHVGRYMRIANPIIDNSILDFVKTLPADRRKYKDLFHKTVKQMFPELYKIRAARAGGVDNRAIHPLLRVQKMAIIELITSYESKLDEVLPREIVLYGCYDVLRRVGLDSLKLPPYVKDIVNIVGRKILASRLSANLAKRSTNGGDGVGNSLMALGPMQLESLLVLRYFLRVDREKCA